MMSESVEIVKALNAMTESNNALASRIADLCEIIVESHVDLMNVIAQDHSEDEPDGDGSLD